MRDDPITQLHQEIEARLQSNAPLMQAFPAHCHTHWSVEDPPPTLVYPCSRHSLLQLPPSDESVEFRFNLVATSEVLAAIAHWLVREEMLERPFTLRDGQRLLVQEVHWLIRPYDRTVRNYLAHLVYAFCPEDASRDFLTVLQEAIARYWRSQGALMKLMGPLKFDPLLPAQPLPRCRLRVVNAPSHEHVFAELSILGKSREDVANCLARVRAHFERGMVPLDEARAFASENLGHFQNPIEVVTPDAEVLYRGHHTFRFSIGASNDVLRSWQSYQKYGYGS